MYIITTTYLSGTDGFTQLTSDAPFLTRRVPPQSVLTSKPGTQGAFLKGVIDGGWLFKDVGQGDTEPAGQFSPKHGLRCTVRNVIHLHAGPFGIYVNVAVLFFIECIVDAERPH